VRKASIKTSKSSYLNLSPSTPVILSAKKMQRIPLFIKFSVQAGSPAGTPALARNDFSKVSVVLGTNNKQNLKPNKLSIRHNCGVLMVWVILVLLY
jgi:hypothetical protein